MHKIAVHYYVLGREVGGGLLFSNLADKCDSEKVYSVLLDLFSSQGFPSPKSSFTEKTAVSTEK